MSCQDAPRRACNDARLRVVCEGDLRAIGHGQGRELAEDVRGASKVIDRLEAFRLRKPGGLPYFAYRRLAERKSKSYLRKALAGSTSGFWERLEGIAEGSGVRFGAICLANVMETALSSVEDNTVVPPVGGCSAVAVRGSRSATGEPVIARNFDYLPLIQPYYILRDVRPRGALRSIEFTVAPMAGAVDGMNESGLCMTYNYAFATDHAAPAPPISFAIAEALARFETVSDAAAWIASRPRSGGGILMLADAGGDIASLELSATRSSLRRPEPGEDAIYHTNHFRCAQTRGAEISPDAVYSPRAPAALRDRRVLAPSERRNARFAARLEHAGPLDEDELCAVMSDHGPDECGSDDTICMHSDYWHTTATMQYFPRRRRIRASYSTACQASYAEILL